MTPYIDGYVLPVRKDKLDAYKEMASLGGKIWMKHGALAYFECAGDDLTPHMEMDPAHADLKLTTFPKIMNAGPDETVVFAFVLYHSRAHRDEVNAKVMADPEMNPEQYKDMEMPMDPSRMAYGGFEAFVHHQA
jgi:uncharacterized protein YbaA (DUF1428 family)